MDLPAPAPTAAPAQPHDAHPHSRRHVPNVGAGIVIVLIVAGKAELYHWIAHHPAAAGIAIAVSAGAAVLKGRPRGGALAGAVAIPLLIAPGWLSGVAIGVAAYVLLIVLFTAIGTLLMWQDHRAAG